MSDTKSEAIADVQDNARVDATYYARIATKVRGVDKKLAEKLDKVAETARDVGDYIRSRQE